MRKFKTISIFVIALSLGYLIGELHFHNNLSMTFDNAKKLFDGIKDSMEAVYYLVASLLIVFAYYQYQDNLSKNKRDRTRFSFEIYRMFVEQTLPQEKQFVGGKFNSINRGSASEEVDLFINLINSLDVISAAFTSGLADKNVGWDLFGMTYIDVVTNVEPPIERLYGKNYKSLFSNIFQLYNEWIEEHAE